MLPEEVKKQRLHVTVGRKVKDRVFEEWETLGYSSASDLVNTALIEFFAREDYRNELKRKKEKWLIHFNIINKEAYKSIGELTFLCDNVLYFYIRDTFKFHWGDSFNYWIWNFKVFCNVFPMTPHITLDENNSLHIKECSDGLW